MFWEEDSSEEQRFQVPDDVVDLSFRISCRQLPVDHAEALARALCDALEWLQEEPLAGVHQIHVAESGNGWFRPEDDGGQLLHLSRRTRLQLRVPKHRVADALSLDGRELDVAGHRMQIGEGAVRPFSPLPTLFARYIMVPNGVAADSEEAFLVWAAEQLRTLDIQLRKGMCGKARRLRLQSGEVRTRSLMVADLEPEAAVRLQQYGLGEGRTLGCGLFLPHKGIKAVHEITAEREKS